MNLDGGLILRNSMLVSFYIGGLAVYRQWDLTRLDRYAVPLTALFCAICMAIVAFRVENISWFRLVAPFMVWPAMSLVMEMAVGRWLVSHASNSFFTFLSHGPIILIMWMIYERFFPDAPYFIYWFVAPAITVLVAVLLNRSAKDLVPRTHALALGGR